MRGLIRLISNMNKKRENHDRSASISSLLSLQKTIIKYLIGIFFELSYRSKIEKKIKYDQWLLSLNY